jgi:hypothetical protein
MTRGGTRAGKSERDQCAGRGGDDQRERPVEAAGVVAGIGGDARDGHDRGLGLVGAAFTDVEPGPLELLVSAAFSDVDPGPAATSAFCD